MPRLPRIFRSVKNPHPPPPKDPSSPNPIHPPAAPPPSPPASPSSSGVKRASAWSVYLIASSRLSKTYVGVTTNFSRRLKQHNGQLEGGAKASSAGRPWVLACIVRGFKDRSEACSFESKWKNISKKMPRKKKKEDDTSSPLLLHREAALDRVKASLECNHLQIEWKSLSS